MNKVTPIIIGTHHYEWAIHPCASLFSKYWGNQRIWYIGDTQVGEMPPNVDFMPVPAYSEGQWNWKYWFGEGLRSICEAFEGHTLAIFFPDHWLSKPVNHTTVNALADYMANYPEVYRASLFVDRSWDNAEFVEMWQDLEIVEVKPWDIHAGLNGGITFCPALWRPEILKDLIAPFWDLWKCERLGTERVKTLYPKVRAIGSRPQALTRVHGLNHGQPKVTNLIGLNDEDKELVLSYLPEGWK